MSEEGTTPDANGQTTQLADLIEPAPKTVDELTAEVATLTRQLAMRTQDREYWQNKYQSAQNDWNTLNEAINEYADEQSMCSSYENKLAEWNDSFSEFSLTGRVKEYEVSVTVTSTYYVTVTVEANSEDDATDKVNEMDTDDIESHSSLDWKYPDDADFETTDVNVA